MTDVDRLYREAFATGCAPEPEITVDVWADANRILSPGEANEHGPYRTARTPFFREIMRLLSVIADVRRITVMKSAQIGVTQVAVNWIGYLIEHAPAPILFYLPTREVAQQVSETRIDPLFENTASLRGRVPAPRSRDKRNTTFRKAFLGGSLLMRGANSAAAFRNISARFLVLDDVDGWPGEVGDEGDPVALIRKRAATFPNSIELGISSPTTRGLSRIEAEYQAGDQRRYFIPCPHCGHMDFLTWSGFRDHVAKRDPGHHRIEWEPDRPETAHMVCGSCSARIEEESKPWMLERGEWRALEPGPGRHPSFHISGLYSPLGWYSWKTAADEWLKAQKNPLQLKVFVNTVLAETYEERGAGAEKETILDRLEHYPAEVPDGVGILDAAVDVHADRLELKVKGWGADLESWLIHWEAFPGDPARDEVWRAMGEVLLRSWKHESGRELVIECTAVDSQFHTEAVYQFCKAWRHRRVFAIRGGNVSGLPIIPGRPSRKNAARIPVYTVCTDTAKEQIYARLQIPRPEEPGPEPGYMHFPDYPWVDAEYAAQLTAEKGQWRYVKGKGTVRQWVKRKGQERNEALDLEVYCLVALHILGPRVITDLGRRAAKYSERPPAGSAAPAAGPAVPAAPRRRRPGGWVGSWRR